MKRRLLVEVEVGEATREHCCECPFSEYHALTGWFCVAFDDRSLPTSLERHPACLAAEEAAARWVNVISIEDEAAAMRQHDAWDDEDAAAAEAAVAEARERGKEDDRG